MTWLPRYLLSIFLLFISCTSSYAETGHRVGQSAPGFTLSSLEGGEVSLNALTQQGHVLLIFWATECVYCYAHIEDFNALHDRYHGQGLTVAAINIAGEYEQEVREYVRSNGLKYLVLADRLDNLDVAEDYHVVGTPTLVLVSPENRVLFYGHILPDVGKWLKD